MLTKLEEVEVRSSIPESARRNQRRIKRKKGKALQRKRSELVERPFAHLLDC